MNQQYIEQIVASVIKSIEGAPEAACGGQKGVFDTMEEALEAVKGFEDADNSLILLDPSRNREGMGLVWFDRVPLQIDSYIDKKTKNFPTITFEQFKDFYSLNPESWSLRECRVVKDNNDELSLTFTYQEWKKYKKFKIYPDCTCVSTTDETTKITSYTVTDDKYTEQNNELLDILETLYETTKFQDIKNFEEAIHSAGISNWCGTENKTNPVLREPGELVDFNTDELKISLDHPV